MNLMRLAQANGFFVSVIFLEKCAFVIVKTHKSSVDLVCAYDKEGPKVHK